MLLLGVAGWYVANPPGRLPDTPDAALVEPTADLPSNEAFAKLCESADAVAALQASIRRYDREVHSFTALLHKRERINRQLHPTELVEVSFRNEPYSVLMRWREGVRSALVSLYVAGQHNNRMLIQRPSGWPRRVQLDPEGYFAGLESRYPITKFGFRAATERTLKVWQEKQQVGELHVEYRGVQKLAELGERPCHVLHRTTNSPEEDGLRQVTVYLDTQTWLQVGTRLVDGEGQLIGEYFFRDVRLNPDLPPEHFSDKQLSAAKLVKDRSPSKPDPNP
jgi:hypothetical protein